MIQSYLKCAFILYQMIHFDFDHFQNLIQIDTKFYKIDTKLITYLGHINLIQIEIRFCTIFLLVWVILI